MEVICKLVCWLPLSRYFLIDKSIAAPFTLPSRGLHKSPRQSTKSSQKTKASSSKQFGKLFALYSEATEAFYQSPLAATVEGMLHAKNRPRITKALSLGLGSLGASKDQPRRMKQLALFMAIASHLQTREFTVPLYAQDPTFTKQDEEFLNTLGIQVLKTPSLSDLGEAGALIDDETLVYSPFLTITTYIQLFGIGQNNTSKSENRIPILIGDDFNALKLKWEKRTAEYRDVEALIKTMKASNYQRRLMSGDDFWEETDNPFPMALYRVQPGNKTPSGAKSNIDGAHGAKKLKGKL